MSDYLVIANSRNWLASVVMQGNRVLDRQVENMPPENNEDFMRWTKSKQLNPDFTHIEDHFFVTAVSKSVEWLLEAHKRNLLEPSITESFLTSASQSQVVRNIREHYIEYLNGGGRQKKKNIIEIGVNEKKLDASIDASSVIVTDEGRLIGGRINVQSLMKEASALEAVMLQKLIGVSNRI